jgi:hypothetical protein
MLNLARQRSAPEVVDEAINLVRAHYLTLVTVSAVAFLPTVLMLGVSDQLPGLVDRIVNLVCAGFGEACLLIGIAAAYRGEPLPEVAALLRAGSRVAWRVIRIIIARNIATWVLMIFLIIPAFFGYAYYLLASPVAALEGLEVGPAIERGAALAKGEYKRIILVAGLSGLLYVLAVTGVASVVALFSSSVVMAGLASTMVEIALLPAIVAITVVLYYDIRERREGVDIEWALSGTGGDEVPSPAPAP